MYKIILFNTVKVYQVCKVHCTFILYALIVSMLNYFDYDLVRVSSVRWI